MSLNIRPSTSQERRLLFIETLINMSNKVSKVSDNSVLSGIAGGVAKISGKAEKDIILAASQLFPDTAYGEGLDQVASDYGLPSRFGAQGSSTYVRLTGAPGTIYLQGTHTFNTNSGQIFNLEENVTIPDFGFTYTKVSSSTSGVNSNVGAFEITNINTAPSGHLDVVNEYAATGAIDAETDDVFRNRIKQGPNILSKGTMGMLDQLFILINNKVLKTFKGATENGKNTILVATQNGQDLTNEELAELLSISSSYMSLTELSPYGTGFLGLQIKNVNYYPLDISFRCELDAAYDANQVRQDIQINISKYFDLRTWNSLTTKIEWDNLLQIVKDTEGVSYVYDQSFYPKIDIKVDADKLPRLRSFQMLNPDGSIIADFSGNFSPIYYPNEVDSIYQKTILRSIL